MCFYDTCTESNWRVWIIVLTTLSILFSVGVAVSMGILMYPGFDECLLFVGVRGEALIYGNPHGCNFMIVGHCCIIFLGMYSYTNITVSTLTVTIKIFRIEKKY